MWYLPLRLSTLPARMASSASCWLWHSTSTFNENPATLLAFLTAFVIEPVLHMWLSLSMTIEERSILWVSAPPTSRPYFSTILKPGVVFLVPAILPFQWCSVAIVWALRDIVAIPLHLASKFKAVRSPTSSFLASPLTRATSWRLPFCTSMNVPSLIFHSTVQPNSLKISSKNGDPAKTPELLA